MKLVKLENKLVISVKNKPAEFLQAYSSNTLDKSRNAFVELHGKIIAVFDQLRLNDDEVLIVIEKKFLDRLTRHLSKYLLLTGTTLTPTQHLVTYDLEGDFELKESDLVIPQKAGKLVLTSRQIPSTVTHEEFTLFRLKNNLPVQGIDYDDELLLNIADEEFVSYTKGCYLGQEIIARVHHRSRPPRQLVVRSENECNSEESARMTSRAFDPDTKRILGFLLAVLVQ